MGSKALPQGVKRPGREAGPFHLQHGEVLSLNIRERERERGAIVTFSTNIVLRLLFFCSLVTVTQNHCMLETEGKLWVNSSSTYGPKRIPF
jgi:hypothetical protein